MRKLTISILLAYLLGILSYPVTQKYSVTFLVIGVLILAAAIHAVVSKRLFTPPVVMSACIALGLLGNFWFSDLPQKSFYPFIDQPITLTARLTDVPEFDGQKVTYRAQMLSAKTADGASHKLRGNVLIYSYGQMSPYGARFYDVVEFKTKLSLPREEMNEGNFDYAAYLKGKNIFVTAETKEAVIANLGRAAGSFSPLTPVYAFKAEALRLFDTYLAGEEKEVVKALLLGVKTNLSDDTKTDFRRAGISHVLAISGLHLNILLLYASAFIALIPRKSRRIAAPVLNILLALFMLFVTGGSASVSRAAIMLIFANLANLLFRERDSLHALLLSALLLLVINPANAYSISFQLSFLATLGIVLFAGRLSQYLRRFIRIRYLSDSVAITLCAQLFTLPVIVYVFNEFSVLTLFSNLLILPFLPVLIISAILFLAAAFLLPFAAKWFAGLAFIVTRAVLFLVHMLAKIPFSLITVSGRHFVLWLAAGAIAAFCVYRIIKTRQKSERAAAGCAIAVTLCCALFFQNIGATYLEVTFLNVGQGDAALIRTPKGQTILIDGGGSSSPTSDTGKYIIQPYLLRRGITHLDYAVVSHFHDDHTEGVISMLKTFDIGTLIVPDCSMPDSGVKDETLVTAVTRHVPVCYFSAGSRIQLDNGIVLETYSPQRGQFYDMNNSSLVLRLTYGEADVLFTGDIEAETESAIANSLPQTDVLKTPHHGSNTSSTAPLLDAVHPQLAVISVGKDNKYGHPSPETIDAFQRRGIRYYRTDQSGTITLKLNADGALRTQTGKEANAS